MGVAQTSPKNQSIYTQSNTTAQEAVTSPTVSTANGDSGPTDEKVLGEVQDVICKSSLILLEGTLTFTTKHLIFVSSDGSRSETTTDESAPKSEAGNTDGEDPEGTVADSDTFSIPLSSIFSVEGKRGMFRPSLTVYWRDDAQNETSKMEFIQKTRHVSASENINDWESKIHHLSTAQVMVAQEINSAMHSAEPRSVLTQILGVLNDGEWKGLIQIERELREQYGTEIDIDELETQCNKLVTEKILERDKIGEFYRKLNVQGSEQ